MVVADGNAVIAVDAIARGYPYKPLMVGGQRIDGLAGEVLYWNERIGLLKDRVDAIERLETAQEKTDCAEY